ncbi:MAG: tRNA pseudouridine(38-40) synthase TruA [Ferruginibacter sp.]
MPRIFIELCYKGTGYAGFQVQKNANTIQAEVEKAFSIYFKINFSLTGSSRTDAGVHALQNYFHTDMDEMPEEDALANSIYHINAILPASIVVKRIFRVKDDFHSRFNADSRTYQYQVYQHKNPFLADTAYFFPFPLDIALLQAAAMLLYTYTDYESFAKRNSQVHTYQCTISKSEWIVENDRLKYTVTANRFLRGMVRGLVGTMLKVGCKKISIEEFKDIIESKNAAATDFSVPPQGLCLINVAYEHQL